MSPSCAGSLPYIHQENNEEKGTGREGEGKGREGEKGKILWIRI